MKGEALQDLLSEEIDRLAPSLIRISRDLYEHPELSLQESRSSALLREALAGEGFELTEGVAGLPTAFVARARGGSAGPRLALLAEYDALPGIGHACGHNIIAAAALGAGLALGRIAPSLKGEILVIGTPAEETIGGKCVMVQEGVFRDVDAAMMVHPGSEWRVEVDSLACITLEVTFEGREAHAVAWPEKGINALDALIQFFVTVDMMKKRLGRDVKIPGVILEGGVRPNIIPARAVGHFSLRAAETTTRDRVRSEFEKAAAGIAAATGCAVSIRPTDHPYDDMKTNGTLAALFRAHLEESGIQVVAGPRPNKGSLDMGNVSRVVPSVHPFIAICDPGIASHSRAFAEATVSARAEEALVIAARALALTALDLFTRPDRLAAAKAEHEAPA